MNKCLIYLLLFFITSCDSSLQMSRSDRAIDKMIKNFAVKLSPYGFHLVGLGGGLDHQSKKHKKIDVILGTRKDISDINEARELLVETIVEFLNYINTKADIQEYLSTIPFAIENIHVSILFEQSEPPNIDHMFNCGKELCYFVKGNDPRGLSSEKVHEETFEEAKQILSEEGYYACSE